MQPLRPDIKRMSQYVAAGQINYNLKKLGLWGLGIAIFVWLLMRMG